MILPSLHNHIRPALSGVFFGVVLVATQPVHAEATPLVLIFDDSLHSPVLVDRDQDAGVSTATALTPRAVTTPVLATPTEANVVFAGAGLVAFTLNATSAGRTHAVSNDMLKAQMTSLPVTLGPFRVVTRIQDK